MQQPLGAQLAQDDDDLSTRPLSITGPYGAITPDPHLVPPLRLHPLLSSSPPSPHRCLRRVGYSAPGRRFFLPPNSPDGSPRHAAYVFRTYTQHASRAASLPFISGAFMQIVCQRSLDVV
ncbi:hypothetical protein ONZ51_g6867 [Trametes cubensis]|uniref:Uncharacterized protein n=1 Tax=Trametes cubensis TaxID=1111947 RepID=A0AAD7TSD0_9APHY|nr:hypothetical protein ONZ51_g6867 [Trametes cubensis]